jgi:hypothetical protein
MAAARTDAASGADANTKAGKKIELQSNAPKVTGTTGSKFPSLMCSEPGVHRKSWTVSEEEKTELATLETIIEEGVGGEIALGVGRTKGKAPTTGASHRSINMQNQSLINPALSQAASSKVPTIASWKSFAE